MYFWLFTPVALIWLWLAVAILYGWIKSTFGWFTALVSLGAISVVAATILAVFGPYGMTVYSVLLQPS